MKRVALPQKFTDKIFADAGLWGLGVDSDRKV